MYRNRDIVNGQEASNEQYLSKDYLLEKLNGINDSSNFNKNQVDNTSTTHFVVIDKMARLSVPQIRCLVSLDQENTLKKASI